MAVGERRFLTGFRQVDTNSPGLVLEDDGTVWLVNPGGSRTQLPGGEGGCAYFACDLEAGTATVDAPDSISITAPEAAMVARNVFVTAWGGDDAPPGETHEAVLAVSNPTGETRGFAGADLAADGQSVLTRLVAQNGLGTVFDQAEWAMTSEIGGGGEAQLYTDRMTFDAKNLSPIDRPTLDPETATAEDIANALIALGLAVSA